MSNYEVKEEFEESKVVIRNRISKKYRQGTMTVKFHNLLKSLDMRIKVYIANSSIYTVCFNYSGDTT